MPVTLRLRRLHRLRRLLLRVALTAQLGTGTSEGGSLQVNGTFDGTTSPQANIAAQFGDYLSLDGTLSATSCTVTFPNPGEGIARPGGVWAHVDCPDAVNIARGWDCHGSADFRFENCEE